MHHCIIHHSNTLLLIIEHHCLLFENVKETIVIDEHMTLQGMMRATGTRGLTCQGPLELPYVRDLKLGILSSQVAAILTLSQNR
jgi:hypothetical protein